MVAVHTREASFAAERLTEASEQVSSLIKYSTPPPVLTGVGDSIIQVHDAQGKVRAASESIAGKAPLATFEPPPGRARAHRILCPPAGLKGCMDVVVIKIARHNVARPGQDWSVYTASPVLPWYVSLRLGALMCSLLLLILALVTYGIRRATTRTLAPIGAIQAELAEITAADLNRRVPVSGHSDEVTLLAQTANHTLDRLEIAYTQLRRFTTYASHEVRTPLTAIRAQVEEALMYPYDTEWTVMSEAVLNAVERIETLMSDLLTLARLDAGGHYATAPTDLSLLVSAQLGQEPDRVETLQQLQQGVWADCDPKQITELLTKLIDNARRHAASQITVISRSSETHAIVEIANDGPEIPAEQHELIFERFTRLDTSSNRNTTGTGLGLAIARRIAQLHRGSLTIGTCERGARFVLRLPRAEPTTPPVPATR